MDFENTRCCDTFSGILISTNSKDYPFVVFRSSREPLYLFPQSLLFLVEKNRFDKPKNQKEKHFSLLSGEQMDFKIQGNLIIAFEKCSSAFSTRCSFYDSIVCIHDYIVISPETPRRRIHSEMFGIVETRLDLLNKIPNIPYCARIAMHVSFEPPAHNNFSTAPKASLICEVVEFIKTYRFDKENFIFNAEWNKHLNACRSLDIESHYLLYPELAKDNPKIRPKPPRSMYDGVILYLINNNQLIWPDKPKYRVHLAGISRSSAKLQFHRKALEKPQLIEGTAIKAYLFYSKINNFYVAYKYFKAPKTLPLITRMVLEPGDNCGVVEYRVILRFSRYKNFFISGKLNQCLIDDPKHLLTNFFAPEIQRLTFPAWIRFKSFETIAKFSVTSLDMDKYDCGEIYEIQDIVGSGFLVNNIRGTVYSWEYPNEKIYLMITDRAMLKVGEIFTFRARFYYNRSIFIIYDYKLSKNEFSIDSYYSIKGFLFLETLNCTKMKINQKVYFGKTFGLVTDLDDLILTEARRRNAELPVALNVLVEENIDEQRCTMFNVYALELNLKELEQEDYIPLPPTAKWWQSNDARKCKCQIIREIMEESSQIVLKK